jgi:WD40 repeat protein
MMNARATVYELDRPASDFTDPAMSFIHDSGVACVSLEPNRSRLLTLDQVGVLREWDLTPRPRQIRSFPQSAQIGGMRINADGSRRLYFPYIPSNTRISSNSAPRIVDASDRAVGDRLAPFASGHAHGPAASADGRIQAIAWHPDQGDCLAAAWDLATGRELCRVALGPGIWDAIAVSPDGARAALLGSPSEMANKARTPQFARIVDLKTGKGVWSSETQGAARCFQGVGFDPSGRHLVVSQGRDSTSDDWAIVWYDATTMAEAARFPVESQDVTVAAFSRDGSLVAIQEKTASSRRTATLRVFPVAPILRHESPPPLFQLSGSSRQFNCLAFSPDGSRLMAVGDLTLRLWVTATGAEVLRIARKDESSYFEWCCFSPDGHEIWSGIDEKGKVTGWNATPLEHETETEAAAR